MPMEALESLAMSLLVSLELPLVACWAFSATKLAPCLTDSIVMVFLGLVRVWFGVCSCWFVRCVLDEETNR